MEDILKATIGFVIPVVEACGALVIVVEVMRTIVLYMIAFFKPGPLHPTPLRLRLGKSMILGLEFQVAADILKTALSPAWDDILQLAALIGLRTVLNYLMEHELKTLSSRQSDLEEQTEMQTGTSAPKSETPTADAAGNKTAAQS